MSDYAKCWSCVCVCVYRCVCMCWNPSPWAHPVESLAQRGTLLSINPLRNDSSHNRYAHRHTNPSPPLPPPPPFEQRWSADRFLQHPEAPLQPANRHTPQILDQQKKGCWRKRQTKIDAIAAGPCSPLLLLFVLNGSIFHAWGWMGRPGITPK